MLWLSLYNYTDRLLPLDRSRSLILLARSCTFAMLNFSLFSSPMMSIWRVLAPRPRAFDTILYFSLAFSSAKFISLLYLFLRGDLELLLNLVLGSLRNLEESSPKFCLLVTLKVTFSSACQGSESFCMTREGENSGVRKF